MPFKSEAQRKFMWAQHPEMAREWQAKTPKGKLPERIGKKKEASDVMLAAFLDELEKIGAVEKDAIFGAIGRGAGKMLTSMRTGLGKALTGAGQKLMPKPPPAALKPGTGWAMGPAHGALPGSAWSKIMKAPTKPAGAGELGSGLSTRAVEQTPQALATKQRTVQMLQSKGMTVPEELQAELAIPVSKSVVTGRTMPSPVGSAPIGRAEGTVSQRAPGLAPGPKPFRRPTAVAMPA